jgi:nicotinate-nucleotide--dimethylbenzimidazole phosphoribosyltransferase
MGPFAAAAARIAPLDPLAAAAAEARHARLLKPVGSLGRLETLGVQLAGIAGVCPPPVPDRAVVAVFAGDHGVVSAGVTPWPQSVTAAMVAAVATGRAAISILAGRIGARLVVVDVGVATALPPAVADHPAVWVRTVRRGTGDLSAGAAMTVAEAEAALDVGAAVAEQLVTDGARLLVTGDLGIGNTTPSAALIAASTGRSARECTGRGTGIDDEMLARKRAVVGAAVGSLPPGLGPVEVLASVGGLEHAGLAGFIVGGAAAGVPVVLDGVIALSAACVAEALVPGVIARCIAGHRSAEPGATVALEHLGLEPLVDLGLRLGEGTGAALAVPLVQAAAATLAGMGTLDELGG